MRLLSRLCLIGCAAISATTGVGEAPEKPSANLTWRRWATSSERTTEELLAAGRERAEREYAEGHPEIETFGMLVAGSMVHEETGLYLRERGCAIMNHEDTEASAYNDRVKELVRAKGLPPYAVGLRDRAQRLEQIIQTMPQFDWTSLPDAASASGQLPVLLGELTLTRESRPNGLAGIRDMSGKVPPVLSTLNIMRNTQPIVELHIEAHRAVTVSLVPDLNILVIRTVGHPTDSYRFVDLGYGKVMRVYPTLVDLIRGATAQPVRDERIEPEPD